MYPTNLPAPTDPRFGNLGIPVGTVYQSRQAISLISNMGNGSIDRILRAKLSEVGLHNKTVAGISGSVTLGAFSVVLSGGYADDDDQGDFVVYTGTGEFTFDVSNPITLLTHSRGTRGFICRMFYALYATVQRSNTLLQGSSTQVADQSFAHNDNRALQVSRPIKRRLCPGFERFLKKSAETKRPVRVIRGYGAGKYAPDSGHIWTKVYMDTPSAGTNFVVYRDKAPFQ
ncbi:hypothetical protein H0H87_007191 [Tephrocybe sp. NHM501043]|nr:hypothetical protein H0H87_007191 [Tephrocybe sp. NHM501043]